MRKSPSGTLRHLSWWALDYAYAGFWQTRAALSRVDPAIFRTGSGTPIVVIPGIYETWKFLRPLVAQAHSAGHPVHVLELLRRNHRPVAEGAQQVAAYLEEHDLRDVVIAAHSKGGLIGKQVMIGAAGDRVRSMLAVATPFGGSRYADLMLAPTLRIFSPKDATILALAEQLDVNSRIVSVYSSFDPHIPEGSELPGATNIRLDDGGHFRILANPRVLTELLALSA